MSLTRFAAAALSVSILWSATADAGGPLHPFKRGFWSGGAYTDDRTGSFTHCSAGVAYDSGINLFVLVTGQYHWWLGFINPKWSFTPDVKSPIRLRLDGKAPFDRMATIPNGQLLLVPLTDSSNLINAFRHSAELALEAEGKSFSFKLNDTSAVMDRLTSCVRTSVALEGEAPAAATRSEAKTGAAEQTPAPAPVAAAGSPSPSASNPELEPAEGAANGALAPAPSAGPPAASSPTASPGSSAAPAEAATAMPAANREPAAVAASGSLSPGTQAGDGATSAAAGAPAANSPAQSHGPPASSPGVSPPSAKPASAPNAVAIAGAETTSAPESAGASPSAVQSIPSAPMPPNPAAGSSPPSDSPHLAFTAVAPAMSTPSALTLPPEPATATTLEEVRLATDFLVNAHLPDAHLVVADKPPALADFAAVWRAEDAAGAVKIIPPGPDVSALGIASNLLAVDPQLCKGDFTAARFRTEIGSHAVFSAVLACTEANEERITEYFIAPRHQGGFVVFALIHSKGGELPDLDRQKLDGLSRAAFQAVDGQG